MANACTTTIEQVQQAIDHRPTGVELIVMGDLNVDLDDPEGSERDETIAAAMAAEGLEDMSLHFRGRRGRGGHTLSMVRLGREVTSKTDYMLGVDRRSFRNVQVRDSRHNSDHFMVVASLRPASVREHRRHVGGRRRFPLTPPKGGQATEADKVFAELKAQMLHPEPRTLRRNAWMSEETWKLVDERVATRRKPDKDQAELRRLSRRIKASLQADRTKRAENAGSEMEHLLGNDPPLLQEATDIHVNVHVCRKLS